MTKTFEMATLFSDSSEYIDPFEWGELFFHTEHATFSTEGMLVVMLTQMMNGIEHLHSKRIAEFILNTNGGSGLRFRKSIRGIVSIDAHEAATLQALTTEAIHCATELWVTHVRENDLTEGADFRASIETLQAIGSS